MRWAITRVLPLPAPASTSSGPFVVVTASRCGALRGARRLKAVTAGCGMELNVTTTARGPPPPHPSPRWGEGWERGMAPPLLDGDGLREVARLVDVATEPHRHVVREQLHRDRQ